MKKCGTNYNRPMTIYRKAITDYMTYLTQCRYLLAQTISSDHTLELIWYSRVIYDENVAIKRKMKWGSGGLMSDKITELKSSNLVKHVLLSLTSILKARDWFIKLFAMVAAETKHLPCLLLHSNMFLHRFLCESFKIMELCGLADAFSLMRLVQRPSPSSKVKVFDSCVVADLELCNPSHWQLHT